MNTLRLASLVALFSQLLVGPIGEFDRARADQAARGQLDESRGALHDPWATSDDLEAPVGDPWRAPQQVERGPRATQADGLVFKMRIVPHWFHQNNRFWYRNDLAGGSKEFIVVDAERGTRQRAFDQEKLASSLSKAAGGAACRGDKLSFDSIEFDAAGGSIRFEVAKTIWTCDLARYECTKAKQAGEPPHQADASTAEPVGRRARGDAEQGDPGRSGTSWVRSPDGLWEAMIKDHNVVIRSVGKSEEIRLSDDGKEKLAYGHLSWAPDSKTLVGWRTEPGDNQPVYLIQSSPPGGGRARLQRRPYPLPGDKLAAFELSVFDVAARKQTKPAVDRIDLGSPRLRWDKDGHRFSYQKTDRGHQRFRLIEVDTHTAKARNLIDEQSPTFIWTAHREGVRLATVNWLEKSGEIIYVSERDGWRHLYLIDAGTGAVKNAITKGSFVVRGIDRIDEETRQVWFEASGMKIDRDPYFVDHYRVNFDGGSLVALTDGDGSHAAQYSPDRRFVIDTYSRVDRPPVHELRRTADGRLVCKLEEADIKRLEGGGWRSPEVFVAKGRDGKTDIWGIICRPKNFDPSRKYPVIEQIYAGPQGSFVPKTFSPNERFKSLIDLGFVVVQVDGMGTANRSKAFHDVCWHDIKDAGFPDRILWHQAIAKKYSWYDLDRVGIYGTSAGGQNATAGLLFHPEFYKVGASACGCHDNRMDKASWNEQWMGYPVGPWYAASSNIDNANRLRGKLLLIVGEMDTNVPPESTMRLADALIRAGKDFELLVVPNSNHGMGGAYGQRRMNDFFVRNLLGVAPPASHNRLADDHIATQPAALAMSSTGPIAPAAAHGAQPGSVDLGDLANEGSELRGMIERYGVDRQSFLSAALPSGTAAREEKQREFTKQWLDRLEKLEFDRLTQDGKVDYLLFKNYLAHQNRQLDLRSKERSLASPLVPFAQKIVDLEMARREVKSMEWAKVATTLESLTKEVGGARHAVEHDLGGKDKVKREAANRALASVDDLRGTLRSWFSFYDGYDPLFTWWIQEPYKGADEALQAYADFLRQRLGAVTTGLGEGGGPGGGRRRGGGPGGGGGTAGNAARGTGGLTPESPGPSGRPNAGPNRDRERGGPIVGNPIGREALLSELMFEMISYSPEELIDLAEIELRWCENEMKKASRAMGHGDDWKAALEHVKTMYVEPGKQPALIRDLAIEAIEYLDAHDLVTVPQLCRDSWRMTMMTPELQLVNPFFTGGEVISVSFPAASMPHEAKLMSMRGNNVHFSRATVFHELIPGHHLQQYMNARHKSYRRIFNTPFWTEGWALYWELLLWDKGFAKSPENRVGMLFWHMHRCARIIFSLSFHLEKMTPQQCIDLLVNRIGHERDNATAEVRRSFVGGYGPLYQAAYLLVGLQLRALHRELVESNKMSDREFHDRILKENAIPIDMVRALLADRKLTADYKADWKFYAPAAIKN
jgi:dipeptidyl aminopeptidase/acylaminoacyl peptidase